MRKIKSYMMPISMITGALFYSYLSELSFLTPYLIFFMLLITYTNISIRSVRFSMLHLWLLAIQLLGSIGAYLAIRGIDPIIAQSAMICILAPTATSAVVITGMLGGNTASLTAFSLLSNLTVAVVAPLLFTIIGGHSGFSFREELQEITLRVFVLLMLPFFLAILLGKISPKTHHKIKTSQSYSFYLWNIALMIVTARTVNFLLLEGSNHVQTSLIIFGLTLIICIVQFYIGRLLGRRYSDTIAGGQGLGQKNTILSIWMAQTYLNPIASIGPGAYILWQNIINSSQVWYKQRRN
ncbi:bile acid:sodium symporter family protein [Dysgonomonas sp. HDW5B]|uniref:bile acid:sodium symporter family protein n=1 Tax=Dysgonomonas sp. HDW5B TaxID=2714927 RepID=UPI00210563D0|nr:bile acid:sodium symporter [Dysgonomonas sp. HDW5B]